MQNETESPDQPGTVGAPWHKRESWLLVCLLAIVPLVAMVFLPESFRLVLMGIAALLFAASVVMLLKQGGKRPA